MKNDSLKIRISRTEKDLFKSGSQIEDRTLSAWARFHLKRIATDLIEKNKPEIPEEPKQ